MAIERRARTAKLTPREKAARFAALRRVLDERDRDEPWARVRADRGGER